MNKKIWIGLGLVALAIGWYAFRPELLFIKNTVSESFPAANAASNANAAPAGPRQLAMGQFKAYAHETKDTAAIFETEGQRVLRLAYFKDSNAPYVHVHLITAPDAREDATGKKA